VRHEAQAGRAARREGGAVPLLDRVDVRAERAALLPRTGAVSRTYASGSLPLCGRFDTDKQKKHLWQQATG